MIRQVLFICALLVIHTIATEINPSKQSSGEILTEVIPYSKQNILTFSHQLQETNFGKGVIALMQVHMNAKAGSSRQIVELLDRIKTHIESEQDWDQGNWDTTRNVLDSIISDA